MRPRPATGLMVVHWKHAMSDLYLPMLRSTGLLASIALAYGVVISNFRFAFMPWFLGLVCGAGAFLAMLDPTELRPGVIVDPRTTMVLLAGFLGGPVAGIIALAPPAIYRIYLGGVGMPAGLMTIAMGAAIGVCGYYLLVYGGRDVSLKKLVLFALASPLVSLGIFMLPAPLAYQITLETFVPVNVARFCGVVILGLMIVHEQRRIRAEDEVRRLAFTDELSGLSNRRAFYAALTRAWSDWERLTQPFSVILIDIDNFKLINDAYGHPTGDEVIRGLARILESECRSIDVVGRLGGEEFAVLISDTDPAYAKPIAERIRARVEGSELVVDGATIRFTISLGVSQRLQQSSSWQDAMSSADRALYAAKRTGRNRVVRDGDLPSQTLLVRTEAAATGPRA